MTKSVRGWKLAVVVAAIALASSGCYWAQANNAAQNGLDVPWFCDPIAPNSVTGPGMGTVNWYASVDREPLDYETCKLNVSHFDSAKSYAERYPTLGDAEAADFNSTFGFLPGMGTHHGLHAITPAMLADPTFNRNDPVIPGSPIDGVFEPARPEFLQYNGNTADSVLVGMSYYVRTTNGLPPAGFPGNNDWWHHHPTLCHNPTTAQAFAANLTDTECAGRGGINLHMQNYYMLHVWVVDDIEYHGDIHAPTHPCIQSGGAIFDMENPCHEAALGATAGAQSLAADPAVPIGFCPIANLGKEAA